MDTNNLLLMTIVLLFVGIIALQFIDVPTVSHEQNTNTKIVSDHPIDANNVAQSKVVVMDNKATTKVVVS